MRSYLASVPNDAGICGFADLWICGFVDFAICDLDLRSVICDRWHYLASIARVAIADHILALGGVLGEIIPRFRMMLPEFVDLRRCGFRNL